MIFPYFRLHKDRKIGPDRTGAADDYLNDTLNIGPSKVGTYILHVVGKNLGKPEQAMLLIVYVYTLVVGLKQAHRGLD